MDTQAVVDVLWWSEDCKTVIMEVFQVVLSVCN